MSTPVRIPLGAFTRDAANGALIGNYGLHALSTDTQIQGSFAGRRVVTYNGGALAMTLSAPVSGDDDGKVIEVLSTTAQAHTITCTGKLKDGNGHSNTLTFAAQPGACVVIEAYQGVWYVRSANFVTGS